MYGKNILIGGIAIAATGGLVYLWYKNSQSYTLDDWLEEYIQEVDTMLKDNGDRAPSSELVAYVINLFEEIEDFLFVKGTEKEETARLRIKMTDSKKYEELVLEAINGHEPYLKSATKILKKRLGVIIDYYRNLIRTFDSTEMKNALLKYRKSYSHLPTVSKEITKKAYLEYVEKAILYKKSAIMLFNTAMPSLEHDTYSKETFLFNKQLLRDQLLSEYQIREKYLDQLLTFHELNEDNEIQQAKNLLNSVLFI